MVPTSRPKEKSGLLLQGKRIFLIEDDVTNLAVITMLLQKSGATVFKDPWGSKTVDWLARLMPVDVILLDLMLRNGASGYDIYDELRKNPAFNDVPVVVVSASDPALEMNKARDKGINGYIEKPISYHTFPDQVRRAIEGESVWAE